MDNSPESIYREQISIHQQYLTGLLRKRTRLGWLRFFIFIVTIAVSYQLFVSFGWVGIFGIISGIGILLAIVSLDSDNNRNITNTKTLIAINEEEIKVLNNHYKDLYNGSVYEDPSHVYANDLDLFGESSIFQYVNRAYSEQGRNLLATCLKEQISTDQIYQRHEAIKELTPEYKWRQQLQAYAMHSKITDAVQKKINGWLYREEKHFTANAWKIIVPAWTIITIATAIGSITGYIPASLFSFLFLLYMIVSGALISKSAKDYMDLSGIIKEINTLYNLINCIENKNFQASWLQKLKQDAKANNKDAADQIKRLETILNRFDLLLNMIASIFLNSFLLWGVRQIRDLNKWRTDNKPVVNNWFDLIAGFELANSLSVLRFNHPDWAMPVFTDRHFTFSSKSLGHPLIPQQTRVVSDFTIEGTGKIGLITGSNMAGKSTFLRSIGINIILAEIGAPVCASYFLLSPVHLMSSMRISDNLSENTSTFYAELKKLKSIIDAVNQNRNIFILLDEILRGTNSLDRHTGSKALITQLIRKHAVAIIATHDLELAQLQQQFPDAIENYHFDVQVEGEELYFDYLLKRGVCSSLNASILMKKIGIDLSAID